MEIIGTEEAARILGMSEDTLIRRVNSGEVKSITKRSPLLKRPRRFEFDRSYIETLAKSTD